MTCELCNDPAEEHHIMTRGRWGESAEVEENKMPLCRKHHQQVHQIGRVTFAKKYGLERRFQEAKWAVLLDASRKTAERVRTPSVDQT